MATKIQIDKTQAPSPAEAFDKARVHVARLEGEEAQRAWFQDALKALLKVKAREVIAIKPDLSAPRDGDSGVTTQRWMIEDTIRWIKRKRGEPVLICAPQPPYSVDEIIDSLDLRGLCKETATECVDPRVGTMPLRPLKHDDAGGRVYHVQISTLAADGIVMLPKLKTANRDTVELGTWGVLSFLSQQDLHGAYRRGVIDDLLELYRRYQPRIRACFVDGTVALEGDGPVNGQPVPMNVLIAGQNTVAVDGVASMIMGFDPEDVDHLAVAQAHGLGDWREVFQMHPETSPLPVRPFAAPTRRKSALEPLKYHPLMARARGLLHRRMS
jgi:uncharacterized protein (DUF362 family)